MQNFSHFGAELSESSKITLEVGEKVIKFLDQGPLTTMPINLQILLFSLFWNNILRNKNIEPTGDEVNKMIETYRTNPAVQRMIDQLIMNTKTFNNMLGLIEKQGEELLSELK